MRGVVRNMPGKNCPPRRRWAWWIAWRNGGSSRSRSAAANHCCVRTWQLIAAHARERGLVTHVTTGYHHLTYPELAQLAPGITALQIGIKAWRLLDDAEAEIELLAESVENARAAGLVVGANLMLSSTVIEYFEHLLTPLRQAGFTRLVLLRYKPPADVARWRQESPREYEIQAFEQRLPAMLAAAPEMTVRLDCALSFLQRHVAPAEALTAGVRGCVAADRILALAPDGSMYPCSQLVHPRCCAGNLLTGDYQVIWAKAPVLKRYRNVRAHRAFRTSWCGICRANAQCGGCRVFAQDGIGGEPACPDPVVAPLTQLGKTGRRLDLARFIRGHGWVDVTEYMQRYGVGEKTALRELHASLYVFPPADLPKKQQPTYFIERREEFIRGMQLGFGCTSGGFPFVSREEVCEWTGLNDRDYPEWLQTNPHPPGQFPEAKEDDDENNQYP